MQNRIVFLILAASFLSLSLPSIPSQAVEIEWGGEDPVRINIYGYFATRYEKVFNEPTLDQAGGTDKEDSPGEWTVPYFNIMGQSQIYDKFRVFFNLSGEETEDVDVENVWGEYSHSERFNVRIGEIYRKFGLYNEILDAVPTYIGIEPPELFDSDHLILSRTTVVMVHGIYPLRDGTLGYSVCTDDGEGDREHDTFPIGVDLNYRFGEDDYLAGFSGYHSLGKTGSDVSVGDGSPESGVLPWMDDDKFWVLGGYFEATPGNIIFQAAFWYADHEAKRNPADTLLLFNTSLNSNQINRFLIDPTTPPVDPNNPTPAELNNVDRDGDYEVETFYIRAGYSFETEKGELVPYIQWDWFKNEETIAEKDYGGDNEAGVADDGEFHKATIGVVYRPIPKVAIKLDASSHFYDFNGDSEYYPEIRFDVSWVFGL